MNQIHAVIKVPLGTIPKLSVESCMEIIFSEGLKAVIGIYWLNVRELGIAQLAGMGGALLLGSQTVISSIGWTSLVSGGLIEMKLLEKPLIRLTTLT
ncbi:uncharacterized protein LOC111341061 isoform X2 [Stylophora pistillata]|uniref:uncharacterized protein LOC111341061 isoform X2 n=1 Tax=Stylophora pistillata TaxID=50429 RepID=UPI000C040C33|nr:uncharacterized protein LOC111341061 isoform X2 [Stylophora pistillata]